MDRLLEFAMNHPTLVGVFVVLLVLFFLLETRRGGKSVSPQLLTQLVNKEDGVILDVRESKEFRAGHITGAKNIPFSKLKDSLPELDKHKQNPIVIICKMGQHSGAAGKILTAAGFADVRRLQGGITTWTAEKLPLVKS